MLGSQCRICGTCRVQRVTFRLLVGNGNPGQGTQDADIPKGAHENVAVVVVRMGVPSAGEYGGNTQVLIAK